ncbi:type IV secretion system protein VirB10 [Pollutimonas bauzanensis]|uniref:Type IV secretion system protein VirB10 n=1 Tax=Pollutimonas bauzanensis TaxID=658167 RepID=A0A1M5YJR7_9BURK|nr:type IV secretion system protein VirB10 [Pollutimonas bauzanensis]SHI11753.1 type IV secretion system protein VirB10 [Pollutimonas bauzanensis]
MRWFKRGRARKQQPVDAVEQIEAQALLDERGRPNLDGAAAPMAPGAKAFLTLILLTVIILIGLLVLRALRTDHSKQEKTGSMRSKIENVLPELKLAAPIPAPGPAPDLAAKDNPAVRQLAQITLPGTDKANSTLFEDPIEKRRLTAGLQRQQSGQQQPSGAQAASKPPGREQDSGPMADRLRPLRLNSAQATLLRNRDLLLTQGSMIDCVQQTKFVSAQAGMITCYATREVRSTNGRVVLIDAGTMFVGYQQSVLAQGQPRIGVVWSRLETPEGVVVELDSPGTGPLGEAGLDGEIDKHFAQRFGGAMMVSLIDDFGNWLSNRGGGNSSDGIRLDSSSDAAQQAVATVLQNTINIPPTLYRNQGGRVGIYVARDLDFSSVYALRPASAVGAYAAAPAH